MGRDNFGRLFLGFNDDDTRRNVTFGDQSPALDALPQPAIEGDVRINVGTLSLTLLKWVCTVSGTPGTWVTVSVGGSGGAILQFDSIGVVGTQLDAFDTTGYEKGTLAYVGNSTFPDQESVHDFYTLVYGENLTGDTFGTDIVNSPTFGVDGAQWRRNGVIDQQAIQKLFWSVDPQNVSTVAHDENTGWGTSEAAADAHPLRSMHALNQRLRGISKDIPLVIHLMSATDAFTYETLTSLSTITGTINYTTVKGTLNVVAGGSGRTVSVSQVAVPAANTERTITLTGADDVANFVGMMVRTNAGTKTAYVTRKVSANVLGISQPRSSDEAGNPGSVVDFADADVVSFYNPVKLSDWPFPSAGCPYPLLSWVRLDADDEHIAGGQIGDIFPTIGQCIFGDQTKPGISSYNLACGGNALIETYSCLMTGQHAESISGGTWLHYSLAVAIAADGPQVSDSNWRFAGELNFVGLAGSPGFRQLPGGAFNVFFAGDAANQIACYGNMSCAFDLWQPQHAPTGSFVVRPNSDGPTLFKWYGICGAASAPGTRLLTLGVGTKSQLPYSDLLTISLSGTDRPIVIDGIDFDFADVPINTLSGATLAG